MKTTIGAFALIVLVGGCAVEVQEAPATSADAISAVDVACTANAAQIELSAFGATAAVAGYLTAAAIAVEALVAAGGSAQVATFGKALHGATLSVAGVTAEREALSFAIASGGIREIAFAVTSFVGAVAASGNARRILSVGYVVVTAIKDGVIAIDSWNPLGVAKNLDILNDGLRFACGNCGEQWACSEGETASRMVEHDLTKARDSDAPPIAQGRACARETSFWSTRRYLTQCFDCCAASGYPEGTSDRELSGYVGCRAVCNAAYQ